MAKPLRSRARDAALRVIRMAGGLQAAGASRWRGNRLLILCYHGFARQDEHLWDPALYVTGGHFEARLRFLLANGYAVLPLREALERLGAGTLPPRAVAITVDDGLYDFHAVAYPVLRRMGVPVTVFVATYHVFDQLPVFDVAFRYLIWKALQSGSVVVEVPETGDNQAIVTPEDYVRVTDEIHRAVVAGHWSAARKHDWLTRLAGALRLDWPGFLTTRSFGLMRPGEIESLDPSLVDIQLHTHRHRVPDDRDLFLREIVDNRKYLGECGIDPAGLTHFCYPSGVHRRSFLPWLRESGVSAAVTCAPRLAARRDDPLLLPRFIDTTTTSEVEFEAWASGLRHLIRKPAPAVR